MDSINLADALSYPLNVEYLLRKKKSIKRNLLNQDIAWLDKKIAILCGSTADEIKDQLELFLLYEGIRPSFYVSEYNQYWEDAVFGNPELAAFNPDIIYVHTTSRNITQYPTAAMTASQINEMLQEQFEHFQTMWAQLSKTYHCPVIQNNFERPSYRLLGNQDVADIHGRSNFIYRLNGMLYEYANQHENFFIHDIDYLCGSIWANTVASSGVLGSI